VILLLNAGQVANAAVDAEEPPHSAPNPVAEEPAAPRGAPSGPPAEVSEPARRRTHAIYLMVGLGSPVGASGFEGVQRFGSQLEIAAGFGVGAAASGSEPHAGFGHVVQWALMPRLRLGDNNGAFTMGAGLSGGQYGDIPLCFDGPDCATTYPTRYVIWSNVEIGYEHWWQSGFAMRTFAGYGHGFASGDSFNLPYFGIGIGYAF
jgi:hypothetical protein